MDVRIIHWQEFGETVMHPVAIAAVVVAGVLVFLLPRRYAPVPIIAASLYLTELQRVVIAGLDFDVMRIMAVLGWARVLIRGEWRRIALAPTDKLLVLWTASGVVFFTILMGTPDAFVNRLGNAFSGAGLYFVFRMLVRDFDDIRRLIRTLVILSLPIACTMVMEQLTGTNFFGFLGGVPEITYIRAGRLRAQASFTHAILAGTFGASLVPLCVSLWPRGGSKALALLGLAGAAAITLASSSSGPLSSYVAALAAISFWPLRDRMRLMRWGTVTALVLLHLVMKAPVWALVNRMDFVSGSTGFHRYLLIDGFIRHFGEWWLCGTTAAAYWGCGLQDITNHYILAGIHGGLVTLALFIGLIAVSFRTCGLAMRAARPDTRKEFFCWLLGSTLFVHAVSFMGVSYFDQIILVFYLLLCMIATLDGIPLRSPESAQRRQPQPEASA